MLWSSSTLCFYPSLWEQRVPFLLDWTQIIFSTNGREGEFWLISPSCFRSPPPPQCWLLWIPILQHRHLVEIRGRQDSSILLMENLVWNWIQLLVPPPLKNTLKTLYSFIVTFLFHLRNTSLLHVLFQQNVRGGEETVTIYSLKLAEQLEAETFNLYF